MSGRDRTGSMRFAGERVAGTNRGHVAVSPPPFLSGCQPDVVLSLQTRRRIVVASAAVVARARTLGPLRLRVANSTDSTFICSTFSHQRHLKIYICDASSEGERERERRPLILSTRCVIRLPVIERPESRKYSPRSFIFSSFILFIFKFDFLLLLLPLLQLIGVCLFVGFSI